MLDRKRLVAAGGACALAVGAFMACVGDDPKPATAPGDAAPVTDTAPTPIDDGGFDSADVAMGDASIAELPFRIACSRNGVQTCDAPKGACCYDRVIDVESADASAFRCVEAGVGCRSSEQQYFCDDPLDCAANGLPGLICCGQVGRIGSAAIYFLASATCLAPSNCSGPGLFSLCDPTRAQCGEAGVCSVVSTIPDSGDQPIDPPIRACR